MTYYAQIVLILNPKLPSVHLASKISTSTEESVRLEANFCLLLMMTYVIMGVVSGCGQGVPNLKLVCKSWHLCILVNGAAVQVKPA